ncbi:unnamed protein product [Absidia cylindrospora]
MHWPFSKKIFLSLFHIQHINHDPQKHSFETRILVQKSLESKKRTIYDRKQRIKEAIEKGQRIPTELRNAGDEMRSDLPFDQAQTEPTTHADDEYSRAGVFDPKILITTSRDPSSRLQQFSKV